MTDQMAFDGVAAKEAAEVGMDAARRAERVRMWKVAADWWLTHQKSGAEFTADDLVRVVGLPDVGPGRNNVVGAWMSGAARKRRIRFAGRLRKSQRVVRHGNLQRVWIVV